MATDSTEQRIEIKQLLSVCELPVADISQSDSLLLFGCRTDTGLAGLIGLEVYGSVALLRSLAVSPSLRNHGLGKSLVEFAEAYAVSHGVESLYLLTTTAETFFSKLGYASISRKDAPPAIRGTSQFSGLCPASSTLMSKDLSRKS